MIEPALTLGARRTRVHDALSALGIRNLVLGIHDAAFPSRADEDVGRGSPYSAGAAGFMEFVARLGFGGVQLGPQGITSASNPSPYDGTLFSKNPLSVALAPLTTSEWGALLSVETLRAAVAARPGVRDRVPHDYVFDALYRTLAEVHTTFRKRSRTRDEALDPLVRGFEAFRAANADWLERDALYEAARRQHGGRHWTKWTSPDGEPHQDQRLFDPRSGEEGDVLARRAQMLSDHAAENESFAFTQYLLSEQHKCLRRVSQRLGLKLFGDLQIGLSARDSWFARGFLLPEYVMGAPPSRTNPDGQAWNYRILDPARYHEAGPDGRRCNGPALRFLCSRVAKLLDEFDGIRVDHPHGLVSPWVYRTGTRNPTREVANGARLFASPDLPDHPALAGHAIARADQIDRSRSRHDDHWVRELTGEQVDRYGILFAAIVDVARAHGREVGDIVCEILSTEPYPLGRVVARYGLGRFRVTQKANLERQDDVYRAENAGPEDWIMLGNHDTRPIWLVTENWLSSGASRRQAEYLATRLLAPEEDRDAWTRSTASDLGALVEAHLANLFVGPARNVQVSFTDLLGVREVYNRPGVVDPDNWSLRVSPEFREEYVQRRRRRRALDLPRALSRALRSRGAAFAATHATLIEDLERDQSM